MVAVVERQTDRAWSANNNGMTGPILACIITERCVLLKAGRATLKRKCATLNYYVRSEKGAA